jgi:hypothetical protein
MSTPAVSISEASHRILMEAAHLEQRRAMPSR